MSSWKEKSNLRKKVRNGGIGQRNPGGKNKRPRQWKVFYRLRATESNFGFLFDTVRWRKMGAYRTQEEAVHAAQNHDRKYSFYETRIEGPDQESDENFK